MFKIISDKKMQNIENSNQKNIKKEKEELIFDFILILENIQKTTNNETQWKRKQITIDNESRLAIENYRNEIVKLETE